MQQPVCRGLFRSDEESGDIFNVCEKIGNLGEPFKCGTSNGSVKLTWDYEYTCEHHHPGENKDCGYYLWPDICNERKRRPTIKRFYKYNYILYDFDIKKCTIRGICDCPDFLSRMFGADVHWRGGGQVGQGMKESMRFVDAGGDLWPECKHLKRIKDNLLLAAGIINLCNNMERGEEMKLLLMDYVFAGSQQALEAQSREAPVMMRLCNSLTTLGTRCRHTSGRWEKCTLHRNA